MMQKPDTATATPVFSVIVPAFNAENYIGILLESLLRQTFRCYEVIVVDDASTDRTSDIVSNYPFKLIKNEINRGPAHCRNMGVRPARANILVFTDSDCQVAPDWLEEIKNGFDQSRTDAIMGRLQLKPSTYLGDSISALGFPAGGSIGFEKIWRVDAHGYTNSLSTCNCAIREDAFRQVGGFEETFPYAGGEDSFLAYSLRQNGYRIKFCPRVLVHHAARDSVRSFFTWQYKRGISSYIFASKITSPHNFISLRLWSTRNIIRQFIADVKFPMVFILLIAGYATQVWGYLRARYNRSLTCTS
jgi:glycosyltransferase involved in cell wall biosynthesis